MSTELEVRTGGALAVGSDQTKWAPEQRAALASAGVSEEVTEAELTVFLHECQRTGLDPFSKQIYLIGRNDKQQGRKVFRSQTAIDGYRVVAHRAARRDGVKLGYAETLWCGPDGVWREAWLWDKPPLAAKVVVYRDGEPFPAIATLNEYAEMWNGSLKGMWARMPANQLAKCAEALALRKAFPNDLGGIYTAEEMAQADSEPRAVGQQSQAPAPLREPEPAKPRKAQRGPQDNSEWETPPAGQQIDDAEIAMISEGQNKALHALLAEKKGRMTDEQRHAGFSAFVGREVTSASQLTHDEASALLDMLSKLPPYQTDEQRETAAKAEAEKLAVTDPQTDPERVEADLRDGLESAATVEEIATVWARVQSAEGAGAIDAAAVGRLGTAASRREDQLKADAQFAGQMAGAS